jgi:hypothetical protein
VCILLEGIQESLHFVVIVDNIRKSGGLRPQRKSKESAGKEAIFESVTSAGEDVGERFELMWKGLQKVSLRQRPAVTG